VKPEKPAGNPLEDPCFDSYLTVAEGKVAELKVKGSRFLGQAFRVETLLGGRACLEAVRRQHHKATHHCWALRLPPPRAPLEQVDDDGEPAGTAGPPILSILRAEGLLEVLVVVTRYFGGTKLGKGGLVRAYGQGAKLALLGAARVRIFCDKRLVIACSYDDLGAVEAVLARAAADLSRVQRDFAKGPHLTLFVRQSRARWLWETLQDATSGRCRLVDGEEGFRG